MFPITEQEKLLILILIVIFLVFIILRWLYFSLKLRSTNRCRDEYFQILEVLSDKEQQQYYKNYDRLAKIEQDYVKLFKQADTYAPLRVILGDPSANFGKMGPSNSKVKNNVQMFSEAIGYFQARRNETLSPVSWIESFLNWPKTVLGNLGFNQEGAIVKILNPFVLLLEVVGGIILLSDRLL